MLSRLHTDMANEKENAGKLERRRSKRQRFLKFFRSWKQKPQAHDEVTVRPPFLPVLVTKPFDDRANGILSASAAGQQ
jgi:hypothetical protein